MPTRAADRILSLETELKDSKLQILAVLKEQEIKHVAEMDALRDQFKSSSDASMAMISKQSQELTVLRVIVISVILRYKHVQFIWSFAE